MRPFAFALLAVALAASAHAGGGVVGARAVVVGPTRLDVTFSVSRPFFQVDIRVPGTHPIASARPAPAWAPDGCTASPDGTGGSVFSCVWAESSEGVNHAPESFSEHFLLRFRSSICGLRKGAVRVNVHYKGPVVNGYATGAQSGYVVATLARAKACG